MNCSKWVKVDLHIHSKYSKESNAKMEIKSIFEKAISEGIKLISITDHNNVDGLDEIIKIYESYKDKIVFLPGIELKTDKGDKSVHILGIFPPNKKRSDGSLCIINKSYLKEELLSKIDLTEEEIRSAGGGNYDKGLFEKAVNFEKTANRIHDLGGLVIAHATKQNGIEEEVAHHSTRAEDCEILLSLGHTKEELMCKYIDICEIRNWSDKQLKQREFYIKQFCKPSVIFSDAHEESKIGEKYSWIKMDDVGFEGLRQILFEPDIRVHLAEKYPIPKFPYIEKLIVNGGYYENIDFTFSPELTSIIGGKGSGKSIIIDLIRFALRKYESNDNVYLSRIYNLLRNGNWIDITYIDKEGNKKTTRRVVDISQIDENTFTDKTDSYINDFDIEIYAQGELKKLVQKSEKRLKLIDDIGKLNNYTDRIKDYKEMLAENASIQCKMMDNIKEDIQMASEKSNLIKVSHEIEEKINNPVLRAYGEIQEEKKYHDLIIKNLDDSRKIAKEFTDKILGLFQISNINGGNSEYREKLEVKFDEVRNNISASLINLDRTIHESINCVRELTASNGDKWEDYYETETAKVKSYLKENKIENLMDETEKLKAIKTRIAEIENNHENKISRFVEEIKQIQAQRRILVNCCNTLVADLRKKREETCLEITQQSPNNQLRITLSEGKNKKDLNDYLSKKLCGRGIRDFDKQIKSVEENTNNISALVRCIIGNEARDFSQIHGVTEKTASNILEYFSDDFNLRRYGLDPINPELFELELIDYEDIVKIEARDERETEIVTYKDIFKFSPGQQCSFLLSLLIATNKYPLIIDQPEDELDWEYIKQFIDKIKERKITEDGDGRQLIFVTHNQNISVLGDSEQIVKVKNIPPNRTKDYPTGEVECTGGLDRFEVREAVLSLEGGVEAFEKRTKKYGLAK